MAEINKMYRLVFVGSFGDFFLRSLLGIFAFIPILGSFFQFVLLKWVVRSTVLAPVEFSPEEIQMVMRDRESREKLASELGQTKGA